MPEGGTTGGTPIAPAYEPATATGTIFAAAWLFLIAAPCLVGYGLNRMFAYSDTDKIVGGDAYNYQILATRGVGFVAAGIASACIACALLLAKTHIDKKTAKDGA